MKTTINYNRAGKLATTLGAALVFATGMWAQPNPDEYRNILDESFSRMETIIARTEEAVKYVAPSADVQDEVSWAEQNAIREELANCVRRLDMLTAKIEKSLKYESVTVVPDEIESAWDRLEMWANNTENEIMYRVPGEEQANSPEFAANDNNQETETDSEANEFLTYSSLPAENE